MARDDVGGLNGHGVPSWIKVAFYYGAPTAIAVYLTWIMATKIAGDVGDMKEDLRLHTAATQSIVGENRVIQQLLRVICVNQASSPEEQARCLQQ